MNTLNNTSQYPACNCGNHKILPEGSLCDICMGMVLNAPLWQENSRFDEAYFEELEEVLDAQVRRYEAIYGAAA